MSPKSTSTPANPLKSKATAVVATLKRLGTQRYRDGLARYAIPSDKAFGVSMGALQKLAVMEIPGSEHEWRIDFLNALARLDRQTQIQRRDELDAKGLSNLTPAEKEELRSLLALKP